ncbi:hypothetical protein B0H11DRAFT_1980062 [Mycena galericulata]|nr:hypothetical protein B0H11DRAFT_1980062 [Mycena galericulata]
MRNTMMPNSVNAAAVLCWKRCSPRQLRRLSLVCRLFRSVCLPLLLQHQTANVAPLVEGVTRHNWIERVHSLHRIALRLDRLAAGPHALSVRSWKVSSAPPLPSERENRRRSASVNPLWPLVPFTPRRGDYSHIVNIHIFNDLLTRIRSTFITTLSLYQNLLSVTLQGMTIDANVRTNLVSLSRLQELTLEGCEITPRDGILLKLERFTISASRREEGSSLAISEVPLQILSPERLLELNLHCILESASLVAGFRREKLSRLRCLSLHDKFSSESLLVLLMRCPLLQSLSLHSLTGSTIPSLPPTIAPLLQNVTAPRDLIPLFIFNRPIRAVNVLINGERDRISVDDLKKAFTAIDLNSSVPLRSLGIPRTPSARETVAAITSTFPALTELSMDIPEPSYAQGYYRALGSGNTLRDDLSMDASIPVLDNEKAFDGIISPDEISDSEDQREQEEQESKPAEATGSFGWVVPDIPDNPKQTLLKMQRNHRPHPTPQPSFPRNSYADFLHGLTTGEIAFPPGLEILRLRPPQNAYVRPTTRGRQEEQEEQALAALSRRYPGLWEVSIGPAAWRVLGVDSYEEVL